MTKSKALIAIVDDDESVCRAIKRLVRSLGMEAHTFTSAQEFMQIVDGVPCIQIDCIVLDVQMPGLNGLQVQERLLREGKQIPIVFITAHEEAAVRERALAAGAVAFLNKPFNDDLFVKTLHVALKRGEKHE
ncbi:MAG TPA: response regulator [Candidatus Acidoferrales bacterium]|nr:response regulator [Candidatus Acidoferrales bacterium]